MLVKKKSTILATALLTSVIVLAASIFPITSVAATTTSGTRTITKTLTIEGGSSLEQIEQQVREQLSGLGLTDEQEEEAMDQVLDQLEDEGLSPEQAQRARFHCHVAFTIVIICTENGCRAFLTNFRVFCHRH